MKCVRFFPYSDMPENYGGENACTSVHLFNGLRYCILNHDSMKIAASLFFRVDIETKLPYSINCNAMLSMYT